MPRITNNRNDPRAHLVQAMFGGGGDMGSSMPRTGEGPETYLNRIDARDAARAAPAPAEYEPFSMPKGPTSMIPWKPDVRRYGPYPGASIDTPVSDHPDFKTTGRGEPVHNDAGEHIGDNVQHYVDPEKHIEFTSKAPWGMGSTDVWQRPRPLSARESGGRTPGLDYGGGSEQRSMTTTWSGKVPESQAPATIEHPFEPDRIIRNSSEILGRQAVHGAGLANSLYGGGHIRNPINVIKDEAEFGHPFGVQWEGHHRVVAAALEQKRRRDAGRSDWSVPVPVDYISAATADNMKAQKGARERNRVADPPDRFPAPDVGASLSLLNRRKSITGEGLEQGPTSRHSPEIASIMSGRPYERPVTSLTPKRMAQDVEHDKVAKTKRMKEDAAAFHADRANRRP